MNLLDESFVEHDTYIQMKCIQCGYQEDMPTFVYSEEADFLMDEGVTEPPCFCCPKCGRETLYRKGYHSKG